MRDEDKTKEQLIRELIDSRQEVAELKKSETQRKRAEEALRLSEEKFSKAFKTSPDAVNINRLSDGLYLDINESFTEIMGYTREEVIGRCSLPGDLGIWVRQEDRNHLLASLKATGEAIGLEAPFRCKDGRVLYGRMSARVLEINGEVCILSITSDITERKRAEEALRKSEDRYRNILESIEEGYYEVDIAGNLTFFNDSLCKMLRYPRDEMMGMNFRKHTDEENADKLYQVFNEVYRTGIPAKDFDLLVIRKDGAVRFGEVSVSPIRDEAGNIIGFRGIARDITDRKQAEGELATSLNKLRRAMGGIIQVTASMVETRDPYTAGHQRRTADLARTIAKEMGLSEDQVDGLRMAGVIHDLGKIAVPAEILSKPTKLSEIEFGLIKIHSEAGFEILKDIDFPWPLARMVLEHHERIDGSGYPKGLKGDALLLETKILSVADVVEAIASHRPYRPAYGIDKALEVISTNKGILFDPEVVNACLKLFKEKGFRFE